MNPRPLMASLLTDPIHYPESDGKPVGETHIHVLRFLEMVAALREYYRSRGDVLVTGNVFLYYEEGRPNKVKCPDVMVIFGVEDRLERRVYKTWEEGGIVPAFILELTSESTAQEDLEDKKDAYEQIGVREYFLFDPFHEYLPEQLMGFRLINGKYEKLMPGTTDGRVPSLELAMWLVPNGTEIDLYASRTGEKVPAPPEMYRRYKEEALERRQIELDRDRLELARQRLEEQIRLTAQQAELDRQRAEKERKRGDALEAELLKLREQLASSPLPPAKEDVPQGG